MSTRDIITGFNESIELSLKTENYFSALTVALIMPDICSKIEYSDISKVGDRYKKWIDNYFVDVLDKGAMNKYLSASNIYALRCSLVHEGSSNPSNQNNYNRNVDVKEQVDELIPYINSIGWEKVAFANTTNIHDGTEKASLFVDIDYLCSKFIEATNSWLQTSEKIPQYTTDLFSIAIPGYVNNDKNKIAITKLN